MDCSLVWTEAFLLRAVKVVGFGITSFHACPNEHIVETVFQRAFADMQRTVAAVKIVCASLIGFRLAEVW